jgi:hypothetical protein
MVKLNVRNAQRSRKQMKRRKLFAKTSGSISALDLAAMHWDIWDKEILAVFSHWFKSSPETLKSTQLSDFQKTS